MPRLGLAAGGPGQSPRFGQEPGRRRAEDVGHPVRGLAPDGLVQDRLHPHDVGMVVFDEGLAGRGVSPLA